MTAPQAIPAKDTAAVRKRRRRAPAGGAADDCFTCSKRNIKCDRRRPYCSQCLEIGDECSGYKTQLTWGVGVASRGKLRGLSLPIAKSAPVAGANIKKASPARSRASSTNAPPSSAAAAPAAWSDVDEPPRSVRDDIDLATEHSLSGPSTPYSGYDLCMLPTSHEQPLPPAMSPAPWAAAATSLPFANAATMAPAAGPFQKMVPHQLPLGAGPGAGEHLLSTSIDSLSDADYMSPMGHSFSREDIGSYVNSPTLMYESYTGQNSPIPQSPASAIVMDHHRAPTSCPPLVYSASEQSSSVHSHIDAFEPQQLSQKLLQECDTLGKYIEPGRAPAGLTNMLTRHPLPPGIPDIDAYSTSATSNGPVWSVSTDDGSSSHSVEQHSTWPSLFEPQTIQISPDLVAKMPFFLDYYKNTMCPSMVFIDGPHNPFRDHILQLAATSQSLRHAICALAACNLRMRRKLSLGQHTRELSQGKDEVQPGDHSLTEEYQHRNIAVHLLNQQLNDAANSSHDSVLATILLLCHYRMVESGIAKFHTQFAGVKKILAMRRAAHYTSSRDSAWMEALFTYFDAISASINDREAQLNPAFYGVMPDAQLLPPGSENLVGCDRELFRTIAKLGRLNLLSQHRPVMNMMPSSPLPRGIHSRSQSPVASPLGHATFMRQPQPPSSHGTIDFFSLPASGNGSFVGSGAGIPDDEELLASPSADNAFWREWKEARQALQSWEFDAARVAATLPGGSPTPQQMRDLGSLSEAFRYAALLYTERLASPHLPSSHSSFQNLVSQVVFYATSLEPGSNAEKFLLWPLFVAGSECTNELQQNIVRTKCREIMVRSGYMNNLAALEVLERIWAGDFSSTRRDVSCSPGGKMHHLQQQHHQQGAPRRGPFNWTKCIGGPGVEVEWIMF